MFSFFDCCLTKLYSYLHKLFCTIILDLYHWLTNSSFWFPMVGSRLIFKPFGVNLSWKHLSRNSLYDKTESFYFWFGQDKMAVYLFFIVSFSALTFFAVVFDKPQCCCQAWDLRDKLNQCCQFDPQTCLTNQFLLVVNNCLFPPRCQVKIVTFSSRLSSSSLVWQLYIEQGMLDRGNLI